eukprot:6190794-Pleurochrysis_carterae.AAC.2
MRLFPLALFFTTVSAPRGLQLPTSKGDASRGYAGSGSLHTTGNYLYAACALVSLTATSATAACAVAAASYDHADYADEMCEDYANAEPDNVDADDAWNDCSDFEEKAPSSAPAIKL